MRTPNQQGGPNGLAAYPAAYSASYTAAADPDSDGFLQYWRILSRNKGTLFLAALLVFGTARTKIDSDEGNWIGTTRYFETYFIQRDYSPEAWADGYWTRTQPMVFRYLIGSWLWLRGHDLQIQNPNYDYSKPAAAM